MAQVVFTKNLERHVACPTVSAEGRTVREVLDTVFEDNRQVRGYVLDDQGALRQHMVIFIDGHQISDRKGLSDEVGPNAEIYIMQALSGGC